MAWCVVATAALCGATSAAPPALSEGRELDPVARDFFGGPPAPSAVEEAAAPRVAAPASEATGASFLANVREVLLSRLTVPLGTVRPVRVR
jgi:hypothetical protein